MGIVPYRSGPGQLNLGTTFMLATLLTPPDGSVSPPPHSVLFLLGFRISGRHAPLGKPGSLFILRHRWSSQTHRCHVCSSCPPSQSLDTHKCKMAALIQDIRENEVCVKDYTTYSADIVVHNHAGRAKVHIVHCSVPYPKQSRYL